ncbi:undecaprenyl-diphosphatase UppP [Halalkalibacterium ligniniphilum]|uniref:undecaprenyl-diphosphatase UppP n=1 Tax=Halalkalibacterium ligniniphilum TaxID=1134413 RepID=UPI00034D3DD7|nr:undecaprenyl-diphosphatase UppP [Halalkalibacterium ligniniphilum]
MSIIEAIIIGIVQGISEFLPVSSTAHIIITQMLFNVSFPGLGFEVFLHLASIFAVIIYYRKDLLDIITGFFGFFQNKTKENKVQFLFAIYLVVATGITGVLGLLLEGFIGDSLKTPSFIAFALAITGIFLIIIERFYKYGVRKEENMTFLDSIIIGLVQTLAVFPGISRSGSTLIAGLFAGLSKETAVRFSFLLSIPVILGSSVLTIGDFVDGSLVETIGLLPLVVAFITTFVCSWLGILWLIDFLKRSKLVYFAYYCFALALFVFFFLEGNAVL